MKKDFYITLDTETANSMDDPLMYDLGLAVHDREGNIYETHSFVIYEVYKQMKDVMNSAYYADKLPQYEKDLAEGTRKMVRLATAKFILADLCKKYNVRAIIAHNARFDYKATQTTQRYITKSAYRYFLPYGVELWDTLKMARQIMVNKPRYISFCKKNGYMTKTGKPQMTAEVLYRWIIRDTDFIESHTGLEDVLIEKEIFAYFVRQKCMKTLEKKCFK